MLGLLAILFVGVAYGACPQDALSVRNQYQIAINDFGFDLALWNRVGQNLIGDLSGDASFDSGTDTTISDSQSLTTTSLNAEVPSQDDLIADKEAGGSGDWFFLFGDVDISGDTATREDACVITIGAGPTGTDGFCVTANGNMMFPDGFTEACTGSVDGSDKFGIYVRRYLSADESNILTDVYVNFHGLDCLTAGETFKYQTELSLTKELFEIGTGITFNSAPADEDNVFTHILGFTGFVAADADYSAIPSAIADSGILTAANSFLDDLDTCEYETWTTSESPVVPGSGDDNFVLTWTLTNYGPNDRAASSGEVRFTPEERPLLFLSAYSNVEVTGGSFDDTDFESGELTTGGAHEIDALEVGESSSITFTATLENCSPSGLPVLGSTLTAEVATEGQTTTPSGEVIQVTAATKEVEIYVQRVSNLVLVETDLRGYETAGLPIPAGCGVPFAYTVDVLNEGPSCAEDLVLETQFTAATSCAAAGGDATEFVADQPTVTSGSLDRSDPTGATTLNGGPMYPGELSPNDAASYTITALNDAPNQSLLSRSLFVTASNSAADRYTSDDVLGDDDDDDLTGFVATSPVFDLTYDVKRYADVQVGVSFEVRGADGLRDDAVVAGWFADDTSDYNLRAFVTLTNGPCVDLTNLEVRVNIELPAGVSFFDVDSTGSRTDALVTDSAFARTLAVDSLAAGDSVSFALDFQACHSASAAASGIRILADLMHAGSVGNGGELDALETTAPADAAGDCEASFIVRRFDDIASENANVMTNGDVNVVAACGEPELLNLPGREFHDDDDDDNTGSGRRGSSSSSSSSSSDDDGIELFKVTRCTLTATNSGLSTVAIKVRNFWDLPLGTQVGKWVASSGVFVDNDWTVELPTSSASPEPAACGARDGGAPTLEVDLISSRKGTIQWVAKVDTSSSSAIFADGSVLGNAVTVVVD